MYTQSICLIKPAQNIQNKYIKNNTFLLVAVSQFYFTLQPSKNIEVTLIWKLKRGRLCIIKKCLIS